MMSCNKRALTTDVLKRVMRSEAMRTKKAMPDWARDLDPAGAHVLESSRFVRGRLQCGIVFKLKRGHMKFGFMDLDPEDFDALPGLHSVEVPERHEPQGPGGAVEGQAVG